MDYSEIGKRIKDYREKLIILETIHALKNIFWILALVRELTGRC